MKTLKLAAFVSLAAGATLVAQENPDFTSWMKTTAGTMGAIRKVESKTGPEVVQGAEKLTTVYDNLITFWKARNAADAVKISEDGKAAAAALASAAGSGDTAKAGAAFAALGGTCKACHDAHREKVADGKYTIK